MKAQMMKFWNDENGATAIEYGLIAGLMVVAVATAIGYVTGGLDTLFQAIRDRLTGSTT